MNDPKGRVGFYDAEALTVDRYSTHPFWTRRYHRKRQAFLLALIAAALRPDSTFLDVGCGTGEYLTFARQITPRVYGVDLSSKYLWRSRRRGADRLVQGDACALPFRDASFDFVLVSEVLEHLFEQERAVGEVFRVARRWVLLSTPNDGLIRLLAKALAPDRVAAIDARWGHIGILPFAALCRRVALGGWRVEVARTLHITPPILDELGVPEGLAPLVAAVERGLELLLPDLGTVSVIHLRREDGSPAAGG